MSITVEYNQMAKPQKFPCLMMSCSSGNIYLMSNATDGALLNGNQRTVWHSGLDSKCLRPYYGSVKLTQE